MCQAKIKGGLGFRDFSSFNQALVAKQGWRILHNLDALMSKILTAKYFKHIDFMEAKLGSNRQIPPLYGEGYYGETSATPRPKMENW